MGTIYGYDAYVFDNMAFEQSAANLVTASQYSSTLRDEFYGGDPAYPLDESGVHGTNVIGEVLSANRGRQTLQLDPIDAHGKGGSIGLHSQALLVALLYGNSLKETSWQKSLGQNFLDAFFNSDIAKDADA